jgi:hypothetical protein
MAYSNSMHFSDKLSYKILCVLSYRLKDTNFARYAYLQQFSEKLKRVWDFSHQRKLAAQTDGWDRDALTGR